MRRPRRHLNCPTRPSRRPSTPAGAIFAHGAIAVPNPKPPDSGDPTGRDRSRAYTQRPRRIPPELAQDFNLELGCSILATLLLYRVITFADDQGRLPGHEK